MASSSVSFLQEDVLTAVQSNTLDFTAEQLFNLFFSDDSTFTNDYRVFNKDTNIVIGKWHASEKHDGQERELSFRSICSSPMCPPDTAMTELQHYVLSSDKKHLVIESKVLAHDVPFGTYFEIHNRWTVDTTSDGSSKIDVKVGVYFKKLCLMKPKIKAIALNFKKELDMILKVGRTYIKKA